MKIAIFGKKFNEIFYHTAKRLFKRLSDDKDIEIIIYKPFYEFLTQKVDIQIRIELFFTYHNDLTDDIDFVFSIGGDGTFLETVSFVRDSGIPIVGINSGRLGFLADIHKDEIINAIKAIQENRYSLEARTLISLETSNLMFKDFSYALNELSIHKKDTSSMITIHSYINDTFLNTYWADGIIISTPTGSTAYSLSVGGPIVVPNSQNFIITPIAPHNLTVRPIVVSDDNTLKFKVEGRSENFLASLDRNSEVFDSSIELIVKKANFKINVIKLQNNSFYNTLRNKLMWGLDIRN